VVKKLDNLDIGVYVFQCNSVDVKYALCSLVLVLAVGFSTRISDFATSLSVRARDVNA